MLRNCVLFIGLLVVVSLSSCSDSLTKGAKSTGGTAELLVVTDTPEQWEGRLGDSVRAYYAGYVDALPQPESRYDLLNASVKKFENNPLYATHSLILVLHADPKATQPSIDIKRNVWAEPQVMITVTASTDSSLINALTRYNDAIDELFSKNQFERTQNLYRMAPNRDAEAQLKKIFGIDLLIPGSFYVAIKTDNFVWMRQAVHRKKQDTELGLVFYTQTYKDTAQFGMNHIIRMRDSIGFNYIKGPTDGSFMSSSVDVIPPIRKVSDSKETGYRVITKGLWMIKQDFMGGPFVTYTLYNKKTNTILTAEGYVYNPNGEKRNFVIQLESVLQSIRFTDEPNSEK